MNAPASAPAKKPDTTLPGPEITPATKPYWDALQAGKARDRRGNPMTLKINGTVEPYFLELNKQ